MVDRFAFVDHDHVGAFYVEDYAVCLVVLQDYAHSFGLTREGEVSQDLIFLIFSMWSLDGKFCFVSLFK